LGVRDRHVARRRIAFSRYMVVVVGDVWNGAGLSLAQRKWPDCIGLLKILGSQNPNTLLLFFSFLFYKTA
jgi:hypothetical protein